jgi:hypothetical protein
MFNPVAMPGQQPLCVFQSGLQALTTDSVLISRQIAQIVPVAMQP